MSQNVSACEETLMDAEIYQSTFCNQGHNVKTGKPVDHQCYTLPPEAIQAERGGDFDKANQILIDKGKGKIVNG